MMERPSTLRPRDAFDSFAWTLASFQGKAPQGTEMDALLSQALVFQDKASWGIVNKAPLCSRIKSLKVL